MVPPTAQRTMARRANAKIQEISSSHAVMLSHPDEVATFIEGAAALPDRRISAARDRNVD